MEQIGTIYVDAGLCWVGDPCYVIGKDASHGVKKWSDFCEKLWESRGDGQHAEPLGKGVGHAISTGYGDGEYPVFVEYGDEGRVKKIVIEFMEDEDEL